MYYNLLVPLDLSARAELGIQAIRKVASRGAAVELFHVIEKIRGLEDEELSSFYGNLREQALSRLQNWATELNNDGYHVRVGVVTGRRGPEIVLRAEQLQCDLLLLPSHALDPTRSHEGLGTVSQQVALVARCAVLLVR